MAFQLATGSAVSALASADAFFHAKTFWNLLAGNSGFATIGVRFVASLPAPLVTEYIQTWNGIGAICDIVIALVMPYFVSTIHQRVLRSFRGTHIRKINEAYASWNGHAFHPHHDRQNCPSDPGNRDVHW